MISLFQKKTKTEIVTPIPQGKEPYLFNLYGADKLNHNVVAVGYSGSGKTPFFKKLIEQEHNDSAPTTSIVVSSRGIEDYADILQNFHAVQVHQIKDFTINPFDYCYENIGHTESKICSLLRSIANELSIVWKLEHTRLCGIYIHMLLDEKEEKSIPTLGQMQELVLQNLMVEGKLTMDVFQELYSEYQPENIKEFLLLEKHKPLYSLHQSLMVHIELLSILSCFTEELSPYSAMFNGQTNVPDFSDSDLVLFDASSLSHQLISFVSLLTDHVYHEQLKNSSVTYDSNRNKQRISFYHDLSYSCFDNPCYSYLVNRSLRLGRRFRYGIRLSLQTLDVNFIQSELSNFSCIYFQKCSVDTLSSDIRQYIDLSELECYLITQEMKLGEGYIPNKEIYLNSELVPY
ncbi:hypothetical protein MHH81_20965 [Psychrobacillus sp. FSL H8-0484]|uniref:hypothetical protein n=1 Tax=Psychrobacillus sp. FSL H8-0484 TaxID=2921390 RepID=UPI0030F94119